MDEAHRNTLIDAYFMALDSLDYGIVEPYLADSIQYSHSSGDVSGKDGFQHYMDVDREYTDTTHIVTRRVHVDAASICEGDFRGVTPDGTVEREFCDIFEFNQAEDEISSITVYSRL